MAVEMQLSCIIRTILIDVLYLSVSLICCDVAYAPSQFSAIAELGDSCGWLRAGWQHPFRWSGLHYRQGVHLQTAKVPSYCTHTWHETGDWNRRTLEKMCGCSKIISVYKMHVNVPIFSFCDSGFTAEMKAVGLLSFWKNMKQLRVCDWPLLSCWGPKQRLQLT